MQSLRIAQSLISLFGFSTMSFFFNTLYLPPISIQMIHDFVAERHYNPHFCVKSNYRSLVQSSYGSCCLFRFFFFFSFLLFFTSFSLFHLKGPPSSVHTAVPGARTSPSFPVRWKSDSSMYIACSTIHHRNGDDAALCIL